MDGDEGRIAGALGALGRLTDGAEGRMAGGAGVGELGRTIGGDIDGRENDVEGGLYGAGWYDGGPDDDGPSKRGLDGDIGAGRG